MGSGPNWHLYDDYVTSGCSSYWWANLLFLNNFIPNGMGNECFGPSWFLAVEMQLFLFGASFTALYLLFSKGYLWISAGVIFILEIMLRIILATEYEISIAFTAKMNIENETMQIFFVKPYCRITVYLFGFICAIIYFQHQHQKSFDTIGKFISDCYDTHKKAPIISFFIGSHLLALEIFGQIPCFSDKDNDYQGYSRSFNIFGFSTSSFIVGLSYSLMFVPLLLNKIKIVSSILSLPLFVPLSKITFCAYLVHYPILYGLFSAEEYGFDYTTVSHLSDFIYITFLSYLFGLLTYLLIEAPFSNILMNKASAQPQEKPLLIVNP